MPNIRMSDVANAILVAYVEEFKDADVGKMPKGAVIGDMVFRYLFPRLSKTKQEELEQKYPILTHLKD